MKRKPNFQITTDVTKHPGIVSKKIDRKTNVIFNNIVSKFIAFFLAFSSQVIIINGS